MSGLPWVRFYPSDALAGTRGMTAAEMGVYYTLLLMMYERGGPIVEDAGRLARVCGASNSSFKVILERLVADGKLRREDGCLINSRVLIEQQYRDSRSDAAREAGKASGRARAESLPDEKSKGRTPILPPNTDDGKKTADREVEREKREELQRRLRASVKQKSNGATTSNELTRSQKPESEKEEEGAAPAGAAVDGEAPAKAKRSKSKGPSADDVQIAFDLWNEMAKRTGLSVCLTLNLTRAKRIKALLRDWNGLDGWRTALAKVEASDWARGLTASKFGGCNLDWITRDQPFTKLMEGAYDNGVQPNRRRSEPTLGEQVAAEIRARGASGDDRRARDEDRDHSERNGNGDGVEVPAWRDADGGGAGNRYAPDPGDGAWLEHSEFE